MHVLVKGYARVINKWPVDHEISSSYYFFHHYTLPIARFCHPVETQFPDFNFTHHSLNIVFSTLHNPGLRNHEMPIFQSPHWMREGEREAGVDIAPSSSLKICWTEGEERRGEDFLCPGIMVVKMHRTLEVTIVIFVGER